MCESTNKTIIANTSNGKTFLVNSIGKDICCMFKAGKKNDEICREILSSYRNCRINFNVLNETDKIINNLITNKFTSNNIRILEYKNNTPPLLLVQLDITWDCNLKCKHCYLDHSRRYIENILTFNDWKNIINQAFEMNVPRIAILGGEPMLSKDFFKISQYVSNKGFLLLTTTNATIITDEIARKFRLSGYKCVDVSLNGSTEETHEFLRGKNSFQKTIKGIQILVNNGIDVKIACIVSNKNFYNIKDLLMLGKNLGISHLYFNSLMPGGQGISIFDKLTLSNKKWSVVLDIINEWNIKNKNPLAFAEPRFIFDRLSLNSLNNKQGNPTVYMGCKAGKRELIISPEGYAVVCPLVSTDRSFYKSNIKTKTLRDIWSNDECVKKLRNVNKNTLCQKCKNCKYVDLCIGGCHFSSYFKKNDFNEQDPRCYL
jgi:radical SAM protein with 4Fe4S-binding SPASM domain